MRHSFYGDRPGRFDASGADLFSQVWWLWLLTLVMAALIGVSAAVAPLATVFLGIAIVIWAPFAFAIYKSREWRWWVSGLRFGDVRFESKLLVGAFMGLTWKVIGWSLLIMAVLVAWISGVFGIAAATAGGGTMSGAMAATIVQSPAVLLALAFGYIVCALAFGVVVRMYLRRDVWARVAASTIVYNLAAADDVAARGEAANALGEGLANSLDIGF
jgi:uncharacterized membrane protein YjgN (DUF898 family)